MESLRQVAGGRRRVLRGERDTHMQRAVGLMVSGLVVGLVGCEGAGSSSGAETLTQVQSELQGFGEGIGRVRCPPDMPAGLDPPAEATLEAAYPARGVQIYVCAVPAAGGAAAWTLKAPHAILFQGFETAVI